MLAVDHNVSIRFMERTVAQWTQENDDLAGKRSRQAAVASDSEITIPIPVEVSACRV